MEPNVGESQTVGEISAALNEIKTVQKMSSTEKQDLAQCEKKLEILEGNIQKSLAHSTELISQLKAISSALNRKECELVHENIRLKIAKENCKKLEEDFNRKKLQMDNLKRQYNTSLHQHLHGNMEFARKWNCTFEGMEMRRKSRANDIEELKLSNAILDKKLGSFKKCEGEYWVASKTLENLKALHFEELQKGQETKDMLSSKIDYQNEKVEELRKSNESVKHCEAYTTEISKLKSTIDERQCTVGRLKLLVSNWNAILATRSNPTLQPTSSNANNTHQLSRDVQYSTLMDQTEEGARPPESKYRLTMVTSTSNSMEGNGKPLVALRRAEPTTNLLRTSQKFNFKKKQNPAMPPKC